MKAIATADRLDTNNAAAAQRLQHAFSNHRTFPAVACAVGRCHSESPVARTARLKLDALPHFVLEGLSEPSCSHSPGSGPSRSFGSHLLSRFHARWQETRLHRGHGVWNVKDCAAS